MKIGGKKNVDQRSTQIQTNNFEFPATILKRNFFWAKLLKVTSLWTNPDQFLWILLKFNLFKQNMDAQAAQIQKKLQIELDSFKATQKGEQSLGE